MEKKEIKLNPTLDVWMITRLMQLVDKDYMNCTKDLPDTAQTEASLEEVNKFPNQFSEIGKTVIIRNRLQDMMNVYNDSVITSKLQKNRGSVAEYFNDVANGREESIKIVAYKLKSDAFKVDAEKVLLDYLTERKLLKLNPKPDATSFAKGSAFYDEMKRVNKLKVWYKPILNTEV